MIRGAVAIVKPGSVLGPAMVGVPVVFMGQAGDSCRVEAATVRYLVPRHDLEPGRLWLARGRTWHGPLRTWREALEALASICPPHDMPAVRDALQPGRGTPLGAVTMAGGWRYRLAWGGASPPARYS